MTKVLYQPENAWLGDAIPFFHGDTFYVYYLYDERKTEQTAYKTSWHLVTTKDFVHWTEQGEVLPIGGGDCPDLACYTGCVMEDKEGGYHLFYTGQNPENPRYCSDGKAIQYILHATSRDLLHWEKHYETAFQAPAELFESHDWRDPFVFYEKESRQYVMLLAARKEKESFRRSGCTAVCYSEDLWNWSRGEILYAPKMYYTHECPDLFREGEWWYLLYSTFTSRFATHYRKSRSLQGPWMIPQNDLLDARGLYAIKTASDGKKRYAFGWIPTHHQNRDTEFLEWGGTLAVHEVYQTEDGELAEKLPKSLEAAFTKEQPVRIACLEEGAEIADKVLEFSVVDTAWAVFEKMPRQGLLQASFEPEDKIIDFGIGLQLDMPGDAGYFFRFEPAMSRVVFDLWPRGEIYGEQHRMGGDIPFVPSFERKVDFMGKRIEIKLLIEADILILYVNNQTAMSVRVCTQHERWGFFATGGKVKIHDIVLKSLPEEE